MVWRVALEQVEEVVHCRMTWVVVPHCVVLVAEALLGNIFAVEIDAQPVAAEMDSMEVYLQVFSSSGPHGPDGVVAPCRWRHLPTR